MLCGYQRSESLYLAMYCDDVIVVSSIKIVVSGSNRETPCSVVFDLGTLDSYIAKVVGERHKDSSFLKSEIKK